MRILHVSDSHLGFSQYARLSPQGLNQRETDVFEAFRAAVDHALREKPDVVVHSGDLFDSVRPTNRAVAFCMEQVRRLAEARIPFFVIAGNHDTPKLRETGNVLRMLEFLPNVRAVFRAEVETHRYGDLALVGVPQADGQPDYEALLEGARPTDARWNVLVAHAGVVGVADFRTGEFNELTIGQERLGREWSYIALGHYHGHVDVAPNGAYAGATERTSLREAGDEKGVVLVDLARSTRTFLPVATRPMIVLPALDASDATPIELGPRIADIVRRAEPAGKILSLRVRHLARSTYAALDFAAIRRAAEPAVHLDLKWEIEETESAVDLAREAGSTLADDFDAFLAATPVAGDRDALRRAAREVLAEAEAAR